MKNWQQLKKSRKTLKKKLWYSFKYIFGHYGLFHKIKWWVIYRTYYRPQIVDTGLEPGYYDIDTRLEAAMFSLLKEFVEKERGGIKGLEDSIKYWKKCISEDKDEYNTIGLDKNIERDQQLIDIYLWGTQNRDRLMEDRSKYMKQRDTTWWEIQQEIYEKDTEMLKLLVEIRGCLWT